MWEIKLNMEIEKKCESAKLYSFLSTYFFFLSNYLKSYNIGITETWERKKRGSQKLSKWGVVKLVGSGKLKNGVDKRDVKKKKKQKNTLLKFFYILR